MEKERGGEGVGQERVIYLHVRCADTGGKSMSRTLIYNAGVHVIES